MMNWTFRLADTKGDDIKPTVPAQVQAETRLEAVSKLTTCLGNGYTVGTLISVQEIKELDE